ncbi:unnamed protein product [Allacma fusca]|uniref:Uncharacterized protein n=1 Tax=Allacma fusca TaxID=39272 RepID=A0A8J2KI19_9HEXA|nr:unnamed protein product [Allacma fusca]
MTCPQSCAQDFSSRYATELGFNAFDVIQTGIKNSVCQSTSVMDDERIWNLRINWEEIMESLSNTGGQQNRLTIKQSPTEKIKNLKNILRSTLYQQNSGV